MKIIFFLYFLCFVTNINAQNWVPLRGGVGYFGVTSIYSDSINNLLYVSGNFQDVDGKPIKYIASWNGISWDSLPFGITDRINDMVLFDNLLYACGYFKVVGSNIKQLASWDGNNWDSLGIQPNLSSPKTLTSLAVINNDLYVAGLFDTIGGIQAYSIAKWSNNSWSSINFPNLYPGQQFAYSQIYSICEFHGKIYVAGIFFSDPIDTIGGILAYNGSTWETVGGGIKGGVTDISSMVVYNNELYVAGMFTKSNGNAGNNIQKWDGISWSDVEDGTMGPNGSNGQIHDLCVFHNELYALGVFSSAGNVLADKIAKFDGMKWCGLGSSFDNNILTGCVFNDSLFVGGGFIFIDGDSVSYIAKWIGGNYIDSCQVVGIDEINIQDHFFVYPSPVNGHLQIKSDNILIKKIKVKDLTGKEIYSWKNNSINCQLDISFLNSGLYFLILETKEGTVVKKFIKE